MPSFSTKSPASWKLVQSWKKQGNWLLQQQQQQQQQLTEAIYVSRYSDRSNCMSFLWLRYKRHCGFGSPSFFLESLPKSKASCPDVSRSLVTITEASSQRIIWVVAFTFPHWGDTHLHTLTQRAFEFSPFFSLLKTSRLPIEAALKILSLFPYIVRNTNLEQAGSSSAPEEIKEI